MSKTALLLIDLQNDFLHEAGAYARGGQRLPDAAALLERVVPLVQAVRAAGGTIISTQFTLVPGRGGEPLIAPHLQQLRPFLRKGDFCPGSWGHSVVEELQPVDFVIEKVAYSAFYQSRLEFVLRKIGVEQLLMAGIVTNGGVASTLRDAHVHGYDTVLVHDGCAAFTAAAHQETVAALKHMSMVMGCNEVLSQLDRG
ncbi:MAG: cysteine hydrolase [Anaerolineales bacterium]|nr:cysteine hydrolase [Anaerolineales bacterium]